MLFDDVAKAENKELLMILFTSPTILNHMFVKESLPETSQAFFLSFHRVGETFLADKKS